MAGLRFSIRQYVWLFICAVGLALVCLPAAATRAWAGVPPEPAAGRRFVPNMAADAGGREVHSRATAGSWSTDPANGITIGSIPNDCGYSFLVLPQTVNRSLFTVSARVRFRTQVDYSGVGLVVLAPDASNARSPHLRVELSERQDHLCVGGWLEANEDHYPALPAKSAARDIQVGEWYRLRLQVEGTRVRCFLDDTEMLNGDITAVSSLPGQLRVGFFIIEADAEFADLRVSGPGSYPGPRPAITGDGAAEDRPGSGTNDSASDNRATGSGNSSGGTVLEERQQTIDAQGGAVTLASGVRFEVPAGLLERPADVRVVQSPAPALAAISGFRSDMYYLSATAPAGSRSGGHRLIIPYDPTRGEVGVYAFKDGILYPAPGVPDANQRVVVIENPRVGPQAFGDRRVYRQGSGREGGEAAARTGYVLGVLGLPGGRVGSGASGESHDEPNNHFRIMVKTPTTPDFVRFVANTLEEAYSTYRSVYADVSGQPPLADLTTGWWRMEVYLVDNMAQTYGEYRNWDIPGGLPNGYWWWPGHYGDWENIYVNVPTGTSDRAELRETLFHEFFHALQDEYGTKLGAAVMGTRWWYESTAEWAGWRYGRSQRLADVAAEYVQKYPFFLSVPIENSSANADNPELQYGYSILIDYIEEMKPGYVRRALISSNWASNTLYAQLVNDGDLARTYPDFVRNVLVRAIPAGSEPWDQFTVHEYDDRTEILRYPAAAVGLTARRNPTVVSNPVARRQPHVFELSLPPLTTKFLRVRCGAASQGGSAWTRLAKPRTIEVLMNCLAPSDPQLTLEGRASSPQVALAGSPATDAWLITANPVARLRDAPPPPAGAAHRLAADGTRVAGLGRDQHEAWIAVMNPDPYADRTYRVSVRFVDDEDSPPPLPPPPAGGSARQTIINPGNRPIGRYTTPGPAGLGQNENEVEITATSYKRHCRYVKNDGTVVSDYTYEFTVSGVPERSGRERHPVTITGRLYGAKIPAEARPGASFSMNTGVDNQGNGTNFSTLFTLQVTPQNPTATLTRQFHASSGAMYRFTTDGWHVAEYRYPAVGP